VKIRRRGRHTSPSQVEKVAAQAGKAAPAVAIAGALVAVPQAQHAAAAGPPAATAAHEAPAKAALTAHTSVTAATAAGATRAYTVRSGDTLSVIAARFLHNPGAWRAIYRANAATIANPNVIYPGERISVPVSAATTAARSYQPRHARPATATMTEATRTARASGISAVTPAALPGTHAPRYSLPKPPVHRPTTSVPHGTLSCSGLERLWEMAGGNPAHAFIAAEIAMAESGGRQYAHSPTNDFGYWQINGSNGSLATYDPLGNAHAAITLSHNGTSWSPWTTYTSGAYRGRC
jgi:LysM repeat protein